MTHRHPIARQLVRKALAAMVALGCIGWCFEGGRAVASELQVEVVPQFHNAAIPFDAISLTNVAGQSFSITRLDLFTSDIALHRRDGDWAENTNTVEFLSLRNGRSFFSVHDVSAGTYDRIRFHVGVRPELNHSKPEQYPPDHPLNPVLDGMHWGWAGGYVFFAIEGRWKAGDNKLSGFSFHLGNDPQLMTVELPCVINADANVSIQLGLNIDPLFDQPFDADHLSTHSRAGDTFATHFKQNVEHAFNVVGTRPTASQILSANTTRERTTNPKPSPNPLPPHTTPYHFTFSSRFPMPDLPRDNPITEEGVMLGHALFNDRRLSINDTQSCASCHHADSAFSERGHRISVGAEGDPGTRNSMPIFNLAWKKAFFWDGRAATLREQALMPIQNPIEMHETLGNVVAKLNTSAEQSPRRNNRHDDIPGYDVRPPRRENGSPHDYPELFQRAFGTREITSDRIAKALEQFMLTRVSFDSKFDRALDGKAELTEEEKRGFQLFITEYDPRREQYGADCFHCHSGPLFQSQAFANNGLDLKPTDLGRSIITHNPADEGKFAVPSLRNVEVTGPYMHDGRFRTLEEVVEHYSTGTKRSATLDPNLAKHPDGGVPLSAADKKALVAFLKTLTDESWKHNDVAASPPPPPPPR